MLMVVLNFTLPIAGNLGWPARVVGLLIAGAGVALTLNASNNFTKAATNIKTFDDPDVLVTNGPFRITRNPMYLGFALLLLGLAVGLGSLTPFVGPIAFVAAAAGWYIPFEERRMIEEFGATYDEYRARVPRWLGRRLS